jgi:hypothetical protein
MAPFAARRVVDGEGLLAEGDEEREAAREVHGISFAGHWVGAIV